MRELVEVTANDSGRWDGVENGKHSDLNHQTLQLVCFGAVLLQIGADLEKSHQASTDEQRA